MKKFTFLMGGVHPADHKIASESAIETIALPSKVAISMAQHLGAPATPTVAKGDIVKVGQVIGEPAGFVSAFVHSSVSGTVTAVQLMPDLAGNPVMHVCIDVEGDEFIEGIDDAGTFISDIKGTPEEWLAQIKAAGIVGMGGATFPAHIKLAPPKEQTAEYLILNGAECEPYVTADDRLMRECPKEIVMGAVIMSKVLGGAKIRIAVEENKPDAIAALKGAVKSLEQHCGDTEVLVMKKKYPQGGEKQLIDAVTGRKVPSGGLPIATGCVVQNVATAYAVYLAVAKKRPQYERIMTVTGECMDRPRNFKVRMGTALSYVLEAAGGIPDSAAKVISGGPMMGKAVANLEATTCKGTSCLTLLTAEQTARKTETACVRCATCSNACPMGLEPWLMNKLARKGNSYDELEQNRIYDCIECGCCQSSCPAHIPLLDMIRINKAEVMKIMRSRAKK